MKPRSRSRKGDSICPVRCSRGVPAVIASTSAPAALPQPVPVLVTHHAQRAADAGVGVGHVAGAGLAACGHETDFLPAVWNASRMGMLWIEITPKAACTPQASRKRVASSPTVMRVWMKCSCQLSGPVGLGCQAPRLGRWLMRAVSWAAAPLTCSTRPGSSVSFTRCAGTVTLSAATTSLRSLNTGEQRWWKCRSRSRPG